MNHIRKHRLPIWINKLIDKMKVEIIKIWLQLQKK